MHRCMYSICVQCLYRKIVETVQGCNYSVIFSVVQLPQVKREGYSMMMILSRKMVRTKSATIYHVLTRG